MCIIYYENIEIDWNVYDSERSEILNILIDSFPKDK